MDRLEFSVTTSHQTQKERGNVDPLRRCKDSLAADRPGARPARTRVTTDTYNRVLSDERELQYDQLLR
jgi:hypothetical protein